MQLRAGVLAAALLAVSAWAGEASSASKAPVASVSAAPASPVAAAGGGQCTSCAANGVGTPSCQVPEEGQNPLASDEAWQEYVREKLSMPTREEPEPYDADPFAFSTYQGRRPEPMGTQTFINGAQMEIATLIVPDAPDTVAKNYLKSLEQVGIRPMMGLVPDVPGMRYLSFRPPGSQKLKTVTLIPQGPGTVILASVGNPEELLKGNARLPGGLPLPPNAEQPSTIQQIEPGASTRSAFFVVRGATLQQVQGFYREELTKRGYSPMQAQESLPSGESFQKDGKVVSVTASEQEEPGAVGVNLMWLED